MDLIDVMIKEKYNTFVGLPNGKPIVRKNTLNDAFPIVVFDILYNEEKSIIITTDNVGKISKYVVAPPDGGIDIVVEHEDTDECSYDFIQVKNCILSEVEIKQCLAYMKRTISDYLKKPANVAENLREVLSETNFDSSYKSNCTYIVVHRGDINFFKAQNKDEKVITGNELITLRECSKGAIPKVPEETFGADSFNNFILYDQLENPDEQAILCNICGYDLALLANKYSNTTIGKNILFGQNLRESLVKSKTYDGMAATINEEPEKFWFFNNGITVVTEDYDTGKRENDTSRVENFVLKNFSIINGAQTTSALGKYLKTSKLNNDEKAIEKLKKVFVLTRILKVKDSDFRANIAIFNNTQNPITTRDMASNREEEIRLHTWLIAGETPNIYVEIRRGSKIPDSIKLLKHQCTTNTELAQLAFAGFLKKPYFAKDKKNSLFDTDYKQEKYTLNEYYHKIFHYSNTSEEKLNSDGILFNKSKEEINELLFVQYLYKQGKKYLSNIYKERIADARDKYDLQQDEDEKQKCVKSIADYELLNSINSICMFYCIALYYEYKTEFYKVDFDMKYKFEKFYLDSLFREALIKEFTNLFLVKTIEIVKELADSTRNLNNWIRAAKSEDSFMKKIVEELQIKISLKDNFQQYVEKFKERI